MRLTRRKFFATSISILVSLFGRFGFHPPNALGGVDDAEFPRHHGRHSPDEYDLSIDFHNEGNFHWQTLESLSYEEYLETRISNQNVYENFTESMWKIIYDSQSMPHTKLVNELINRFIEQARLVEGETPSTVQVLNKAMDLARMMRKDNSQNLALRDATYYLTARENQADISNFLYHKFGISNTEPLLAISAVGAASFIALYNLPKYIFHKFPSIEETSWGRNWVRGDPNVPTSRPTFDSVIWTFKGGWRGLFESGEETFSKHNLMQFSRTNQKLERRKLDHSSTDMSRGIPESLQDMRQGP